MASINTSINGVTVSVTKQADGTITWSADSVPGASYGPSGSGLVPGHAGGVLDAATINDWTNTTISSRQAAINYVNDAQAQINDTTRNPPYDPAYIASLKSQIASSEANIQQLTDSISLSQSLSTQINSLTQQVNSAATEPPAEAQTNAEKNAADAQTASPDSTSTTSTPVPTTTGTEDPTNPSTTDQDTADKYATASPVVGPPQIQVFDDGSTLTTDASGNVTSTESTDSPQANRLAGLPPGATAPGTLTALSRSIGVESGGQLGGASATWSGAKDM